MSQRGEHMAGDAPLILASDSQGRGASLGISIVDPLLQRYGGNLRFDNAPGGGLRVEVVLPRKHQVT